MAAAAEPTCGATATSSSSAGPPVAAGTTTEAAAVPITSASEIARVMSLKEKDFFALLRLDVTACSAADVKAAYKKAVLVLHPDKVADEELKKKAADAFARVEKAYSTLNDESVLKRFKEADSRKRQRDADMAKNRGRSAADQQSAEQARMAAEERYLAGLRTAAESEAKKRRLETERKKQEQSDAQLEAESNAWKANHALFGF